MSEWGALYDLIEPSLIVILYFLYLSSRRTAFGIADDVSAIAVELDQRTHRIEQRLRAIERD